MQFLTDTIDQVFLSKESELDFRTTYAALLTAGGYVCAFFRIFSPKRSTVNFL